MKRLRRILLIGLGVLLLASILFGLWLNSGMALRWVVAELTARSGGAITVAETQGTLAGPFALTGIEVDAGRVHAHADSLTLEWRPLALLGGSVHITHLRIEGTRVEVGPGTDHAPAGFPLHPPELPLMPVRVVLEDAQMDSAALTLPDSERVTVRHLSFAGRMDNRSVIMLRAIDLRSDRADLKGNLQLDTRNRYAMAAQLDWRWRQPGWAMLVGHTEIAGDAASLRLKQTLAAPYGLDLDATLTKLFTAPAWKGVLKANRFAAAQIHPGWSAFSGSARLGFDGDLSHTALEGSAAAEGPGVGRLDAHLAVVLAQRYLAVKTLELSVPKSGTQLMLKGNLDLDSAAHTRLYGSWRNLAWPLDSDTPLRSPAGELQLTGDEAGWELTTGGTLAPAARFDAHATVSRQPGHAWKLDAAVRKLALNFDLPKPWMRPLLPGGNWLLAAHGDMDRARLDRLSGNWLGGGLVASGSYARSAPGQWQARANLHSVDPGQLTPDWPGKLDVVVDASGDLGGTRTLELKLDSLKGTLRGLEAQASGSARFMGKDLLHLDVNATLGKNHAETGVDLGKGMKLTWKVQAPDLSQAWPELAGSLASVGRLDSGRHYTLLQLNLDAEALSWRQWQVKSLRAQADVEGAGGGKVRLSGNALQLPGVQIASLAAAGEGTPENHGFELDLDSDKGMVHLAGQGGYADRAWHGTLSDVMLEPTGAGAWRAPEPWKLALSHALVSLPEACLAQDGARLCGGAGWRPGGWQAQAHITSLPIADLQSFLPMGLTYTGAFDADLTASGDRGAGEKLKLDATLTPGAIHNLVKGHPVTLLAYASGEAHYRLTPRFSNLRLSWRLSDGGHLDVDNRIQRGGKPRLAGRIRGELNDFDLVPALFPQVSSVSGKLNVDVALSGTPLAPEFSGNALFGGGELKIPRLGLSLTAIQARLTGSGGNLTLSGSARSGDGSLTLSANATETGSAWKLQGNLKGDRFRSIDIPEAQVDVSPDISFGVDGRDVTVDGAVGVPYARLAPRDLTGTAQVSPDQVIVGEDAGGAAGRWRIHARLRAILGPDVQIDGFGLRGKINGEVTAADEPGRITTGSGELSVQDGQYSYVGQKLDIEVGRLLFTGGPISDPALDVRAVRHFAPTGAMQAGTTQKVGVMVRGSLKEPQVTLFSDPPLPQGQMMNYLLFGSTGLETAGVSAGTPGATPPGSQTANSPSYNFQFGSGAGAGDVSYQNVTTTGPNNTVTTTPSLFLGKYLSPRLYVSYGFGINSLRIVYTLGSNWLLQAETGTASGADIIYTIEH